MIGALRKWFVPEEESREARLERLANELRSFTDEDRRRFIKRVWGDAHLALNPPRGVPKKRKVISAPDPKDFESPEEFQNDFEKHIMKMEAQREGDR